MATPSPWWMAHVHEDRRPRLMARNRIRDAVRAWFAARDFVEVDTAALQVSPGNEVHLAAFAAAAAGEPPRYLHTSPEFACKKLLAGSESRLFSLAHVFRAGERSALHHPEFTMLEWYRAHVPYRDVMDDASGLLGFAAAAVGGTALTWSGRYCDPSAPPQCLSVADAFERHAGVDLLATIEESGVPDRDALALAVAAASITVAPDDTWSDLFAKVLVTRIEPHLGIGAPTLLVDYPVPEAALARRSAQDPRVAERFELYACGVELANGYGELTDSAEQRRRFEADMAEKERRYGVRHPIDEDFLAALSHMPEASGVAMGFDRLVMLCTGASRIEDVLWTPTA